MGWSDEELQGILFSWQYKTMKVKLTSLGMYRARTKDFCAGFDLGVWASEDPQKYRVENKHLVQLEIPKHFLSCLKTPCLNACFHHLPRHVNTLFNNMFKLYLTTCLQIFENLLISNLKACKPHVWRHVLGMN